MLKGEGEIRILLIWIFKTIETKTKKWKTKIT